MKEKEQQILEDAVIPADYDYHQRGKRTTCNEEITLQIATLIAKGSTAKDAAILSGINPSTYAVWRKRGRLERDRLQALGIEDDDISQAEVREMPYLIFFHATEKAIPMRKALFLGRIEEAGRDTRNWTANAWLLERIHPDEFGRQTRHDPSKIDWREEVIEAIKDGLEFKVVVEGTNEEEARALFERAGVEIPGIGAGDQTSGNGTEDSRADTE